MDAPNHRSSPSELPDLTPDASGSAGIQESAAAPAGALALTGAPDQSHLGAALGEYADTRSRVVTPLAIAAYRDAFNGREEAIRRWEQAVKDRERLGDALAKESTKVAVLEERDRGRGRLRRLQQAGLTVGSLLAGSGFSWAIADKVLLGPGSVLVGAGLLVLALALPLFGKDA